MNKLLSYLLLALLSFTAYGQVEDFYVSSDNRVDGNTVQKDIRLQERIRIGYTINAKGYFEVVGLASTGARFGSGWSTLVSSQGNKGDLSISMRQLFLRKKMGAFEAELGALTPEVTPGSSGQVPLGWVDGTRIKFNHQLGNIKVVAGSFGDFQEPSVFARTFKPNYFVLELEKKLFDKLITNTALEIYDGKLYLRENARMDVKLIGERAIQLYANALFDPDSKGCNYDVGVELDVLKTFMDKLDQRLRMRLYVSNVSEKMPNRTETISSFYTYGPRTSIQFDGKIDKQGNINWFARAHLSKEKRFTGGISIRIDGKNKEEKEKLKQIADDLNMIGG